MDNKKEAVNIGINLSSSIFGASLGILAMLSGFSTFILQEKEINILFGLSLLILFLSFTCFVVSIYWGGKGINKARKEGFNGRWDIEKTTREFNNQAIYCIIGLILFLILFLLNIGNQKVESPDIESIKTQRTLEELVEMNKNNTIQQEELIRLKNEVKRLSKSLDSIIVNQK